MTSSVIHVCGLHTDGAITCWGLAVFGTDVAPDGEYSSVSAGSYHTCFDCTNIIG